MSTLAILKEVFLTVSTLHLSVKSFLCGVTCDIHEFIQPHHHFSYRRCFTFSETKAQANSYRLHLSFILQLFRFVFWFQFVAISFWTLYTYNRELVYPKSLDGVIPLWLNHAMVSRKHPCLL